MPIIHINFNQSGGIHVLTPSEFNDMLRESGRKLGMGEVQEVLVPFEYIAINLAQPEKISKSYLRNIISRVKEVQAAGKIKMRTVNHPERGECYRFTIEPVSEIDSADKEAKGIVRRAAKLEELRALMDIQPNITDLEPEALIPAMEAVRRFHAHIQARIDRLSKKEGDEE
ncbi:hypothetical protein F414_gp25 [Cronobacter phage ESP2949-1]|uniref:Uncharacterized protein n=1 Tax=Cronobacter phage ESP2949-1 TaxID=2920894 RepID=G1CSS2_9CAUD|nr:hypothetical protein F414_gp25 [Cronobacter phage ESP2949-1]AEM24792.1 hypothetical protein [Cronobacter phage ESP2949-1]